MRGNEEGSRKGLQLLPWGNIPLFVVFILLKFYLTLQVVAPIEIEVGDVFWKVLDVP